MAGFVTVDAPLRPMIDTLGGLKNALNDTETIKEIKLSFLYLSFIISRNFKL